MSAARRLPAQETDETKRQTLLRLLEQEEAKLGTENIARQQRRRC